MKFSVIIPIFNSEKYLSEAIDSVLNQSISANRIEIILVNDGSYDKSEEICKKYLKKFKDNIKYVAIKNGGPAKARNIGFDLVSDETDYICFLDADDRLDSKALEKAALFFSQNPQVKIAVLPIFFFERKNSPNKLNYRFNKGTRVINISNECNALQFYIGGVFVERRYVVDNQFRFNEQMMFWEDALLVNQWIISELQYGVIDGTAYYYRKRSSSDSLVDLAWNNKYRYSFLLKHGYRTIINFSIEKHGFVLPYVQNLILYHLKQFFNLQNNKKMMNILDDAEISEFISELRELLQYIDDKKIIQSDLKIYLKQFLLQLKPRPGKTFPLPEEKLKGKINVHITKLKLEPLTIKLSGYIDHDSYIIKDSDKVFIEFFSKRIIASNENPDVRICLGKLKVYEFKSNGFTVKIPIWIPIFRIGLMTSQKFIYIKKINLFFIVFKKIVKKILGYFKSL